MLCYLSNLVLLKNHDFLVATIFIVYKIWNYEDVSYNPSIIFGSIDKYIVIAGLAWCPLFKIQIIEFLLSLIQALTLGFK